VPYAPLWRVAVARDLHLKSSGSLGPGILTGAISVFEMRP
jgi:hypothetical protein